MAINNSRPKKVLVTAGSTIVPIDKVRVISNIFTGKTGTSIARYFASKGDNITLVTSNPGLASPGDCLSLLLRYRTYDELAYLMEEKIRMEKFDIIIHSAAVSDYKVSLVCTMTDDGQIKEVDASKKISSRYDRIYLEMVPTEKLVDLIRQPWGFKGDLVEFKLEAGLNSKELISRARTSRLTSRANLVVANSLGDIGYVYIINGEGPAVRWVRNSLAHELYLWSRLGGGDESAFRFHG